MFDIAYLKRRLGQYGAVWVAGFVLAGAAILSGMAFTDMMAAADIVLPVVLAGVLLALGAGVVLTFVSAQTMGTKLAVLGAAVFLALPLMWSPVSAAVAIAFFADRSIEYSQVYAALQIGVSRLLFPVVQTLFGDALLETVWSVFQAAASVVGFLSALVNIGPMMRRLLGPEPAV